MAEKFKEQAIIIRQEEIADDIYTEEELQRRKAAWVCPEPKVKTGYLARYAKMVTSADKGAILDF